MTPFEAARQVSAIQAAQRLGLPMRRSGSRYVMNCLFHADRRPSLTLYPGTGGFYCFSCRAHGDAARLYQQALGLKPLEAAKRLCDDFQLAYDRGMPRRRAPPSAPKADARVLRKQIVDFREKHIQQLTVRRTQAALKMAAREEELRREGLPFDQWWDDAAWANAMQEHAGCEDEMLELDAMSMTELWTLMQKTKEETNGRSQDE